MELRPHAPRAPTVVTLCAAKADEVARAAPPSPARQTEVLPLRAVEIDGTGRVPSPAARASEAGRVEGGPATLRVAVMPPRAAEDSR